MNIILQIIIAALSVTGLYFSAKVLFGLIFPNGDLTRSVNVDEKNKLVSLDIILTETRAFELCSYKNNILLTVGSNVYSSCTESEKRQLYEIANKYGAKIVFY